MSFTEFENRKKDHIELSLNPKFQASGQSGLDSILLQHDALPEIDFSEVSLEATLFQKKIATPFFIAGMTAGHLEAPTINFRLAQACQKRGWAMGVGSQRRQIEENRLYAKKDSSQFHTLNQLDQWKRIRENCPDLILFSNLGISQVIALTLSEIHELNKSIQANAMVIHLNALQEVLQKEGTPLFRGALEKIREISKELKIPLILKETGCGFSERTLEKIKNIPFAALDVSGLGGTHWGRIEGARNSEGSLLQNASETFANWGVSTVQSVLNAKKYLSHQEIWASGGVRSGLDAAKLLTLGADRVGFAQPALSAVLRGEDSLSLWMEQIEYELKIAFFCMGIKNLNQLKESQGLWTTMKNY